MAYSEATKAQIFKLAGEGKTKRAIANKLGLDRNAVARLIDRAAAGDKETPQQRNERLQELAKERDLLRDVEGEKSFRAFLSGLVEKTVRQPLPKTPTPIAKPSKTAQHRYPYLSLNDWHFEETVEGEAVLGLNEYSIPIACRRVWRVVQAVRHWKRDIEAAGRFVVPKLHVGLNGDFLTGTLHGLERHSGAPNIVRSALSCGDLIGLALFDLAQDFAEIEVTCTVGNHGRLPDDRKVPTKDPTRSWDFLAYGVAKRLLSQCKHVRFHMPNAYGTLFEVGGHLCYQAHGNFIPQSLGIVGYGIRRFTSNLAANVSAAGKSLKYAFFGHWHQSNAAEFAGIKAFVCPSLIGTQEYSFLSGGSVARAAQEMHVFDKQLGYVTSETLYGDGPGYDGTYQIEV